MSKERIYLVRLNGDTSLVKATSKAKAKNFIKKQFIAGMTIGAEVASQATLIALTKDGKEVQGGE